VKIGDRVKVVKDSFTLCKGDIGVIVEENQLHPTGRKQFGVAFSYDSQGSYPPVKIVLPLYIEVIQKDA
tara:strand:+ start:389 stop:595 length:207 start_codon:yes stop_codon:yes gene_type:complete